MTSSPETESLGNRIYEVIVNSRTLLFATGRRAQLANDAFHTQVRTITEKGDEKITIEYPLGQDAGGQVIPGSLDLTQDQFISEYNDLLNYSLPSTGLLNLVMTTEMLIEDISTEILMRHPRKLGKSKDVPFNLAFDYDTLEEVRKAAVNNLLRDLFYASPKDVADTLEKVFSFNLLEIPEFMRYLEIKATRDVFTHNRGIANEIYRRKSGALARVEVGEFLPITISYFMQSYESCIKLTEKMEEKFHSIWPSSLFEEERKKREANKTQQTNPLPALESKSEEEKKSKPEPEERTQ